MQDYYFPRQARQNGGYLIRHGKTLFNIIGQVQGWSDSPSTKQGIEQAKRAGKGWKIFFTTAFSSDSGRARASAKLILQQNNAVNKPTLKGSPALREWGYGGYERRDMRNYGNRCLRSKTLNLKKTGQHGKPSLAG